VAATRQIGAAVGDTVEVSGRRVGDAGRAGEILEVIGDDEHPHYRVRWGDGHETVLYPGEATTIRPKRPRTVPVAAALVTALRDEGMEFEVLPHRRTTTAAGEAAELGVLPQTVAKTLVLRDESGRFVRAVLPATSRLDASKVADAIGGKALLVDEADLVNAYPEFELGAVPPFGGPQGDRVVVDRRLAEVEHVVIEAGVHDRSIRLRTEDLLIVADAQLGDIAQD
jgi:prolyl-tRNA editing enzyme YbaK/EbsC (Cys-tRNA(Pro) deacylase)